MVIRGLQTGWPALELWTPEYFRSRYGDHSIQVREYEPGEEYAYKYANRRLADMLDHWENAPLDPESTGPRTYLAGWNFVRDCPELLDDFTTPEIFSEDCINRLPEQVRFGRMWLFFGEPGCSTGIHCDTFSTSAWLTIIKGTKSVRFVPPEAGVSFRRTDSMWSQVTYDEVIRETGLPVYEVTLQPGDTLYIPADWFHEVRNPERNLMLTANFAEERKLLSFLAQFETRLIEPISVLRETRNELVERLAKPGAAAGELHDPAFRAQQLDWVRGAMGNLRTYEETLMAWDETSGAR
ncbi:cupin-like domain-containing protein [Streptomyces bambusae]|uniref:cupin-like domain-containing protein n=1 Tax=Streptomyces bambusae TaxID=1550616 RepID=UPI0027E1A0A7|nr:cupin-like domain-containing protein [Streptomyces bambusae]